MDSNFTCAFCGEDNSIFVDPTGGSQQTYVEDCQVCCRPNLLTIVWDDVTESYLASASPESD
jgi:hypothetical protein